LSFHDEPEGGLLDRHGAPIRLRALYWISSLSEWRSFGPGDSRLRVFKRSVRPPRAGRPAAPDAWRITTFWLSLAMVGLNLGFGGFLCELPGEEPHPDCVFPGRNTDLHGEPVSPRAPHCRHGVPVMRYSKRDAIHRSTPMFFVLRQRFFFPPGLLSQPLWERSWGGTVPSARFLIAIQIPACYFAGHMIDDFQLARLFDQRAGVAG